MAAKSTSAAGAISGMNLSGPSSKRRSDQGERTSHERRT
jgi:hypothetical protein